MSCQQLIDEPSIAQIPLQQSKVVSLAIEEEEKALLELSGNHLLAKYNITTASIDSIIGDEVHYSNGYLFYCALVSYPTSKDTLEPKLTFFKTLRGCCMRRSCKLENYDWALAANTHSVRLMIDEKTPSILGNDSIYLSMDGKKYWTLPMEGRLSSWRTTQVKTEYWESEKPRNLFRGILKLKEKEEGVSLYLHVGYLSYEYGQEYDWNAFFNSSEFKDFAAFGDHRLVNTSLGNYRSNQD